MKKRTKIIATVGPATASSEMLLALYEAGVNVIRFNFSHADYATATSIVERIRELNASGKTSLSLLLDTKGPELRTGDLKEKIEYRTGDIFRIYPHTSKNLVGENSLTCDYPYLIEDIKEGDSIEIDSGLFHVVVVKNSSEYLEVRAENDALIGSRRHVNLPGIKIRMPGITTKDKEDLIFAIKMGFHFIAASFVRTKENVIEIREYLDQNGGEQLKIISKIENEEGIENLLSIVEISDGVMVARGDLGIEVPIEKVPKYQKRIIDLCRQKGKFVIVATHMLESMIDHPFPTRAEVSDIFRAVLQGADATMLSGETTTGKYPIESVEMMRSVILEAEGELEHKHHEYTSEGLTERDIEKKYLIRSALHIAEELGIKTVLVFTKSGRLARLAAAYRPNISIEAFSGNPSSIGYMEVLYGVNPHLLSEWGEHQTNLESALKVLVQKGSIHPESRVIAVTDVLKNMKEIPVMEIIKVGDIVH
ncbi:pyruvate kinase [Candidatus Gracilibacteria bacterium]|nr:pyruvate kinase [Candidatus Gracilibacteria bacterium]